MPLNNDRVHLGTAAPNATVYYIHLPPNSNSQIDSRLWSVKRMKIPTFDPSEVYSTELRIQSATASLSGNVEFASYFQRFLKLLETTERERLRTLEEAARSSTNPIHRARLQESFEQARLSMQEIEKAKSFVDEASCAYEEVRAFSTNLNRYLNELSLKEQTPVIADLIQQTKHLKKDLQSLVLPSSLTEASVIEYVANVHHSLPELKQRFEVLQASAPFPSMRKDVRTSALQGSSLLSSTRETLLSSVQSSIDSLERLLEDLEKALIKFSHTSFSTSIKSAIMEAGQLIKKRPQGGQLTQDSVTAFAIAAKIMCREMRERLSSITRSYAKIEAGTSADMERFRAKRSEALTAILDARTLFNSRIDFLASKNPAVKEEYAAILADRLKMWNDLERNLRHCNVLSRLNELIAKIEPQKTLDHALLVLLEQTVNKASFFGILPDNISQAKALLSGTHQLDETAYSLVQAFVAAETRLNGAFIKELSEKREFFENSGYAKITNRLAAHIDQFTRANEILNSEGPITLDNLNAYLVSWRESEADFTAMQEGYNQLEAAENALLECIQRGNDALRARQDDESQIGLCNEINYRLRKAPTAVLKANISSLKNIATYQRAVHSFLSNVYSILE